MHQAARCDILYFDTLSPLEDGIGLSKVDGAGGEIVEALVISALVVMLDEVSDGVLRSARQIVVFQQDADLEGLMPPLDLALDLQRIRCPADMINSLIFQPVGQVARDVRRAIFGRQSRPMATVA